MKPYTLFSLALLVFASCTKKCPEWYEGNDCKDRMTEKFVGDWKGTLTETNITQGGNTFSDEIQNLTVKMYFEDYNPANQLEIGFAHHCFGGLSGGCVSNPNSITLVLTFISEIEFDVVDYFNHSIKVGSGSITLNDGTLWFSITLTSSSSNVPVQSGTFSFTGTKQ